MPYISPSETSFCVFIVASAPVSPTSSVCCETFSCSAVMCETDGKADTLALAVLFQWMPHRHGVAAGSATSALEM